MRAVLIMPRDKRFHTSIDCEKVDEDIAVVSDRSTRLSWEPCNQALCQMKKSYTI